MGLVVGGVFTADAMMCKSTTTLMSHLGLLLHMCTATMNLNACVLIETMMPPNTLFMSKACIYIVISKVQWLNASL